MNEFGKYNPEIRSEQEVIEAAFLKASEMLNHEAIDMDEFRGQYGDDQVDRDIRRVEELDRQFAGNDSAEKKLATILEAIFYDQTRRNGWFGEGVKTLRTSKYDDYINGVDAVAEFEERGRSAFLALAIDATSSTHPGNKFNRIKADLEQGKLGKLKYFRTENFSGELRGVPKVVVGATTKNMKEVIDLWLNNEEEKLREHPIQTLFLEEIVIQLESFHKFCQRRGQDANAKVFEGYLNILQPVLEQKRNQVPVDKLKNDQVMGGIRGQLLGINPPTRKAA